MIVSRGTFTFSFMFSVLFLFTDFFFIILIQSSTAIMRQHADVTQCPNMRELLKILIRFIRKTWVSEVFFLCHTDPHFELRDRLRKLTFIAIHGQAFLISKTDTNVKPIRASILKRYLRFLMTIALLDICVFYTVLSLRMTVLNQKL